MPEPIRIIVFVQGGVVQQVCCSDPYAVVAVADYDNAEEDEVHEAECVQLEAEATSLHVVK